MAFGLATMSIFVWWATTRDRISSSMIAGAITGILESLLTFPMVNVTVQLQLSPLMTTAGVISRTFSRMGISGFYLGITPVLIAAAPSQALRWGAYETACSCLGCNTTWQVFVSGLLSGVAVAVFAGVPIESFKLHAISAHWSENLPSRISDQSPRLKGWFPTVAKKICSQAVRFPTHHVFLRAMCDDCQDAALSFAAGMLTGVVVVIATHPLDVIKSRMQSVTSDDYNDSLHCLQHILAYEGCYALTRGATIRMIRSSLGTGITFMFVPMIRTALM